MFRRLFNCQLSSEEIEEVLNEIRRKNVGKSEQTGNVDKRFGSSEKGSKAVEEEG